MQNPLISLKNVRCYSISLAVLSGFSMLVAPVRAQDGAATPAPPPAQDFGTPPPFVAAPPPFAEGAPLSLREVFNQVERNFPRLLAADAQRQIASARLLAAQGAFDPVVFASQNYLLYNSSSEPGKEKSVNTNIVGIEVQTRYGTKLFAQREQAFGAVKSPSSSTGTAGTYSIGIKQPLARDAGINPRLARERQARIGEPLADVEFATTRLDTLLSASGAYWRWVAAGRRIAVNEDILRLAIDRAEYVRKEIERGARAGIDQYEADREVALRRESLEAAKRALEAAAFELQRFLWDNNSPNPAPGLTRIPEDALSRIPAPLPETLEAQGKQTALDLRPEIRAVALNREIVQVDADLARNDLRPTIDLTLQPGQDLGTQGIGETLKAGVVFSVPFYQRDARGRLEQAELQTERLNQEERLIRQTVLIEVDDAASQINRTYLRYLQAQEGLQNAIRLEQGERVKFLAGDSTLFLVNQRERARAEAAIRVIDVLADFELAQIRYLRVLGVL
ncbi:MAG: TolC family protein [Armatimonadaceae bacterium]